MTDPPHCSQIEIQSESVLKDGFDPESMVLEHLDLATRLASRFVNRGEPLDDLIQTASLALVKASRRFDSTRGIPFSAFATQTIVGELKHHLRDRAWAVRVPRSLHDLYLEASNVAVELTQTLGRSPTIREIAMACSRTEDQVLMAIEAGRNYRVMTLPDEENSGLNSKRLLDNTEVGSSLSEVSELSSHLSKLGRRDREIVTMRFVDELTQSQIAEQLGISQMQVSRVLRDAISELRNLFRDDSNFE